MRPPSTPDEIAPATSEYSAGDVVADKYRLVSVIGEGGMGTVWLARNLTLDADVCVKLIRHEVAPPQAAERLLTEARAAARLTHPSIVRVFDFGETALGDPFIVMELLHGESLRDVLVRKGRLPAANAVATLLPVASALVEAHAKGIVHRDLKPENIMLVTDEAGAVLPKIVDFGVAKLRREDVEGNVTQAGTVLGSPDYMAPEQAQGRDDIDGRADEWALAVMLYEIVTGRLPFAGDNYNALAWAVLMADPAPITELDAGDDALWAIVNRALAKDRDVRWPTAKEFGVALAEWAAAQGVEVDVTGASIALGWLSAGQRRPLSEFPMSESGTGAHQAVATLAGDTSPATQPTERHERVAPSPPEVPAPARGRRVLWMLGAVVLAFGAGVALRVALARRATPSRVASKRAAPERPAALRAPHHVQSAKSAASPAPASAAPATSVPAAPPRRGEIDACAEKLFPEGTFQKPELVDFSFVCREADPRAGAQLMEHQIVVSRGTGVSEGMKEWSTMTWYEMAAFAVARDRCCRGTEPAFKLPPSPPACPPLGDSLRVLGAARGSAIDGALADYTRAVDCLVRTAEAKAYPFPMMRMDGRDAGFRKWLGRAR